MKKIILSADSTCDLGDTLKEEYQVDYIYNRVQIAGRFYIDMVEITPDDVYKIWKTSGNLPSTSAISPADYIAHFKKWTDQGYEVIHLTLGSGISGSYQNARIAAKEVKGVYVIDSKNLCAGFGCLVLYAGEMIRQGLPAKIIQEKLERRRKYINGSFLLDTLTFMKEGGRCSTVTALGANLLKIKPCIEVDTKNSAQMHVGRKYRGNMEKCIREYIRHRLEDIESIDLHTAFIAHSGSPRSDIDAAIEETKSIAPFENIYISRTNTTISSHCGPRTLGIFFMNK